MKKRLVALLTGTLIAVSVLSGCGESGQGGSTAEPAPAPAPEAEAEAESSEPETESEPAGWYPSPSLILPDAQTFIPVAYAPTPTK